MSVNGRGPLEDLSTTVWPPTTTNPDEFLQFISDNGISFNESRGEDLAGEKSSVAY